MDIETILNFRDPQSSITEKVHTIEEEIRKLKEELREYSTNDDVDPKAISEDSIIHLEKTSNLIDAIDKCKDRTESVVIKDIANSAIDLQKVTVELEKTNFILEILDQFYLCENTLDKYYESKARNDYCDSVLTLSKITEILNSPVNMMQDMSLYRTLKINVVLCWEQLINDLSEIWSSYVNWSESESENKKVITLNININKMEKEKCVLKALFASKQIHMELTNFSNFLLKHILSSVVHKTTTIEIISETDSQLRLTILTNSNQSNYFDILNNLHDIFEFIANCVNVEFPESNNFVKMVGNIININFSDMLIKDCLVQTIPNSISELQNYAEVTSEVEKFQQYLTSINFFEQENFSLLQYTNNIDVLFANKTSQYFLENARKIMKKDLGNIMSVGVEVSSLTTEEIVDFPEMFTRSPFLFPRCAVSRSCQELLDLITIMMEQATLASEMCSRRLYFTARNIFELYTAIVPLHFKESLENWPQLVAVFHNNCMYLSHHLMMLGEEWSSFRPDAKHIITFCDQVKQLRDLGAETLLEHMRNQKNQLLDCIHSSDLYHIGSKDSLEENAEKSIRQCLRQLQLLKTVWTGIFPPEVYQTLITMLANIFVDELVSRVLTQEDITAKVASQLSELYKIVLQRLPQIYVDQGEIEKNVSSWGTFKELIFVLNGSLVSIEERWFSGMGPLAVYFKPEELKHLIRALFQNTTVRANLLSKIK